VVGDLLKGAKLRINAVTGEAEISLRTSQANVQFRLIGHLCRDSLLARRKVLFQFCDGFFQPTEDNGSEFVGIAFGLERLDGVTLFV
jgi:hypothetical protein